MNGSSPSALANEVNNADVVTDEASVSLLESGADMSNDDDSDLISKLIAKLGVSPIDDAVDEGVLTERLAILRKAPSVVENTV